jgi:hypothetical protein
MTFLTGTMFDGNPGGLYYGMIETAATALGYEVVETVVIGANTHKILRNPAVGNSKNKLWYIDINYPTSGTSGGMRFTVFEDYNSTTHLAFRGPPAFNAGNAIDPTTFSRYGATGSALETNWANTTAYTAMSLVLSAVSHKYYISITRDRIIMMVSNDPAYMLYTGFYEPQADVLAYAGAESYPLISMRYWVSSGAQSWSNATAYTGGLTRLPRINLTSSPTFTWSKHLNIVWGSGSTVNGPGFFLSGTLGASISPINNKIVAAPLALVAETEPGITAFLGTISDMAIVRTVNTVLPGDTVTISGDTWYLGSYLASGGGVATLMRGL